MFFKKNLYLYFENVITLVPSMFCLYPSPFEVHFKKSTSIKVSTHCTFGLQPSVLMTNRGSNCPKSHIHSKRFPAVFLFFFIATCSDMTSVDGSVVCPLRADMALRRLFESVRRTYVSAVKVLVFHTVFWCVQVWKIVIMSARFKSFFPPLILTVLGVVFEDCWHPLFCGSLRWISVIYIFWCVWVFTDVRGAVEK